VFVALCGRCSATVVPAPGCGVADAHSAVSECIDVRLSLGLASSRICGVPCSGAPRIGGSPAELFHKAPRSPCFSSEPVFRTKRPTRAIVVRNSSPHSSAKRHGVTRQQKLIRLRKRSSHHVVGAQGPASSSESSSDAGAMPTPGEVQAYAPLRRLFADFRSCTCRCVRPRSINRLRTTPHAASS